MLKSLIQFNVMRIRYVLQDLRFNLRSRFENNRRLFWLFVGVFAVGMVLGFAFRNTIKSEMFVKQSVDWLVLIVFKPSFFGTFGKLFLFYFAFFLAFFLLCSFNCLYPLSFLLVAVRGSVFVLATMFLIEVYAFLAIVYFLFMLVLQQFFFIALAGYTCSFCREGFCHSSCRFDYLRGRFWQFLLYGLLAAVLMSLFLCLLLYLVINPLLSFL